MLRLSRLQVADEIENGLAYYRYTFLAEVPRALPAARRGAGPAMRSGSRCCRRSCAWARGSAATATAIRSSPPTRCVHAVRAQAAVVLGHYLDEVHRLGGELSLSTRLVRPTEALLALAAGSARRQPAPPGRALPPGADRRLRAARRDGGAEGRRDAAARAARHARRPTTRPTRSRRPRRRSRRRSRRTAPPRSPTSGSRRCATRSSRSASISRRSTCARTADVHEVVVGELLERAGVVERYARSTNPRASRCSPRSSRTRGRCARRSPRTRSVRAGRARDRRAAAAVHAELRRARGAALRDLEMPVGIGPARGRRAAQGRRPASATARSALDIVPLFETIDDLARARPRSCARRSRCRRGARWSPRAASARR